MEFMGLCCGGPVILVAAVALWRLWRVGNPQGRGIALGCGTFLGAFILLATYSEGRYIMLEEGIVMDACDGDANKIRWRLGLGASANAKTDEGLGALSCAATNVHVEAAKVLLEHGADPDATPERESDLFWSKTPRQWAGASKDPALVRLFAGYAKRKP